MLRPGPNLPPVIRDSACFTPRVSTAGQPPSTSRQHDYISSTPITRWRAMSQRMTTDGLASRAETRGMTVGEPTLDFNLVSEQS